MQKIAIIKLVVCASRRAVGRSGNLGASINVLDIICPPVEIVGFTDLEGGGQLPLLTPVPTALQFLNRRCRRHKWILPGGDF